MTWIDDYELGVAIVVEGARLGGRDVDEAALAAASVAAATEVVGRAARPLLTEFAMRWSDVVAMFEEVVDHEA